MPFPYDRYPWLNFQELNLAYFIKHFQEIFEQWTQLLADNEAWKTATEQDLEDWKADTLGALEVWKTETESAIEGWESTTLAALTTWQTAAEAAFEAIRVQAAASATAAAGSATAAQTAQTAAEAAQTAAEAAQTATVAALALVETRLEDIERHTKEERNLYKVPYTPTNMSLDANGRIYLDKGYVNQTTGYSSATSSGSTVYGKYLRTQAGSGGASTFLEIGTKALLVTLDLDWVQWTCYSYSSNTNASATHSNSNSKYIAGTIPIFIPKNETDVRFNLGFRGTGASDSERPVFTDEQINQIKDAIKFYVLTDNGLTITGSAADAAVTGSAIYADKNRGANLPAALTWWEVPETFTDLTPIYPADVPMNTYTAQLGSLFGGFAEKGVPIDHPNAVYYLFAWRSRHNSNIRFYQIFAPAYGVQYYASSIDGGSTLSVMNPPGRSPGAKIMWLGDSIIRGRVGGESANYKYGIPYHVGRDLSVRSENFGIGNLGWIAGYIPSTSPSKTNAFGYLKRVGNPDYYDPSDSWSGYKFLGSGDWSDFNTIVFSLGVNDGNYPLGSLSDIDDSLSYATVMAWKTSAADSDATNRTIVKAIYQCYRYIRESEAMHASGEPYVAGGSKMNIILCDPLITGNTQTGTPPSWSYDTTLSGGYTRRQLNQLLAAFAEKYGCGHISNYDAPIDRVHLGNSLPDGVHPNRPTYDQLGRHFAGKVSALVI